MNGRPVRPLSLRAAVVPALAALALATLAAVSRASEYNREDWVYSLEPTHPGYYGINHWGLTSFDLPYRVLQRGKHELENRRYDNWRFGGGGGGWGGVLARSGSTVVDFALFTGGQNFDHVMGHDVRTREIALDYPDSRLDVSSRFTQVLPAWLGGSELLDGDITYGRAAGPDQNTLINSTLWEMRNQYVHAATKRAMLEGNANMTHFENILFHSLHNMFNFEWREPQQGAVPYHTGAPQASPMPGEYFSEDGAQDYVNYLLDLNTGRYGVMDVDAYRVDVADLQAANLLKFANPVFWASAYRYGSTYLGRGENRGRMPMLQIPSTAIAYLPGLRVMLSPFGIEYIQDNYFRWRDLLANLHWSTGDNAYEERTGAGIEIENIPLFGDVTAGVFGEYSQQPFVSRLVDTAPLAAAELGQRHGVHNVGGSLRVPVAAWGGGADPRQVVTTLKAGSKNTGWLPGEYIKGGAYAEVGLGVHF